MEALRIVVASPGDVPEERGTVERVVDELNRGVAADRNVMLQVVRWETDAYPGFHVEGPQALIDSVLKLEDADCLIGIFWKRFGTPVKDAGSGTADEISVAYQAWQNAGRPHVMVYFCERPYTPKSRHETEQWGQVLDFRANFPPEGGPRTQSIGFLMRALLPSAIGELGPEGVAKQLHLPVELPQRIVDRPALVVCMIGRPGAGKTTVANALLRALQAASPNVRTEHISDLEFVRQVFSSGETRGRYEATNDGGFLITDRTLYRDALLALADLLKTSTSGRDLVLAEFARNDYVSAFTLLEEQGIKPDLIVYLDVPLSVAQERNRNRSAKGQGHFVSEREMEETFATDDLAELQAAREVSVLKNEEFKRITAEQAAGTVLEIVRQLSARP